MSIIRLREPLPMQELPAADRALERLHYFPGRSLGEREFDLRQSYADARLATLAMSGPAGIVRGLQVRTAAPDAPGEGCLVSPGLAVAGDGGIIALYAPLRQGWQDLISGYLERTGAASAAGVFHLVLRRDWEQIDADPETDPCQRTYLDPHRDARRIVAATLALRRLAVPAEAVTAQPREQTANRVVADRVDGAFPGSLGDAVPLGLLAVRAEGDGHVVAWFEEAAGRYPARRDGGYRVLLAQVDAAFQRAMATSDTPALDFLPAAGALPPALLQDPAARQPGVAWLPAHLGVDMVPVPEDSAGAIVERHLARRPVDLRRPAGERLRLLLAVDEADYRPDLLDFPQRDQQLMNDLFRQHRRAHEAWRDWRRQYNRLYFVHDGVDLDTDDMAALALPEPAEPPPVPGDIYRDIIDTARAGLARNGEGFPHPYDQGEPEPPEGYRQWLAEDDAGNPRPPAVEPPDENGLTIQYALVRHELERTENRIRALQSRLDKTRDYILVQRQQLDSQTVSLSALAGGVASDGAGLQLARWLPYADFERTERDSQGGGFAPSRPTFESTFTPVDRVNLVSAGPARRPKARASSALELTINRERLDRLSQSPKQTLTKPTLSAEEKRFGVLSHMKPEESEYRSAQRGMCDLVSTLDGTFDAKEAKAIKKGLKAQEKSVGGLTRPDDLESRAQTLDADLRQLHYEELFKAGRILARQIGYMEARQNRLEAQLLARNRDRERLQGRLYKLSGLIDEAREALSGLDGRRVERLGDYGVAQKLVDEDWRQVYQRTQARARVLTERLRGLYYVRVRDAAVSTPPADPLALRHAAPGDPVPGCDWDEDASLPEALDPFFEAVLEVPVDDWRALRPLRFLLPRPADLDALFQLRQARFRLRPQKPLQATAIATPRLQTLALQNRAVLQEFSNRRLPTLTGSLRRVHEHSARTLSLEDVLGGGRGRLRRQGEQLRDRLEQAGACLLALLRRLPPSLRLQWAELAEEDRLTAHNVAMWPGLERAEREAFNTTRTLAELVTWWFGRLEDDAAGASRSALRNLVRAAVIQSALGDPGEILQGRVRVPPRRLAPGERLRLDLNRPPDLGDTLQLLDPAQRVVGTMRVEDHDERGTVADLVEVSGSAVSVTTNFTAVASGMARRLSG